MQKIKNLKFLNENPVDDDGFEIKSSHLNPLLDFINVIPTPFNLAIYGDWGSGKSTIIKILCKSINEKDNFNISYPVEIDVWALAQLGETEHLAIAIVEDILSKINNKTINKYKDIKKNKRDSHALIKINNQELRRLTDKLYNTPYNLNEYILYNTPYNLNELNELNDSYFTKEYEIEINYEEYVRHKYIDNMEDCLKTISQCNKDIKEYNKLCSKDRIKLCEKIIIYIIVHTLFWLVIFGVLGTCLKIIFLLWIASGFLLFALIKIPKYFASKLGKRTSYSGILSNVGAIALEKSVGSLFAQKLLQQHGETTARLGADIEKRKEEIKDIIKKSNVFYKKEKIIIFVDNLDRLAPEKAVETLEILNIFLKEEGLLFVIPVDKKVLYDGIEKRYINLHESERNKFFNKLFQDHFEIPLPQYKTKHIIEELIEYICIEYCDSENKLSPAKKDGLINHLENLIAITVGNNPREIKRLFISYIKDLKIILKRPFSNNRLTYDTILITFADKCYQHFETFDKFTMRLRGYGYKMDLDYIKRFRNSNEVKKLFNAHGKNPENEETYNISNFITEFYDVLKSIDNDTHVNEALNEIYEALTSEFHSGDLSGGVPPAYAIENEQEFEYENVIYSKAKNNLDNLAKKIIENLVKIAGNNEDKINDLISKIEKRVETHYDRDETEYDEKIYPVIKGSTLYKRDYVFTKYYEHKGIDIVNGDKIHVLKNWEISSIHSLIKIYKKEISELEKSSEKSDKNKKYKPVNYIPLIKLKEDITEQRISLYNSKKLKNK